MKREVPQGISDLAGLRWILSWCRGRDSNPHRNSHYHLKIACLPIPPPRRGAFCTPKPNRLQVFFGSGEEISAKIFPRAGVSASQASLNLASDPLWRNPVQYITKPVGSHEEFPCWRPGLSRAFSARPEAIRHEKQRVPAMFRRKTWPSAPLRRRG